MTLWLARCQNEKITYLWFDTPFCFNITIRSNKYIEKKYYHKTTTSFFDHRRVYESKYLNQFSTGTDFFLIKISWSSQIKIISPLYSNNCYCDLWQFILQVLPIKFTKSNCHFAVYVFGKGKIQKYKQQVSTPHRSNLVPWTSNTFTSDAVQALVKYSSHISEKFESYYLSKFFDIRKHAFFWSFSDIFNVFTIKPFGVDQNITNRSQNLLLLFFIFWIQVIPPKLKKYMMAQTAHKNGHFCSGTLGLKTKDLGYILDRQKS